MNMLFLYIYIYKFILQLLIEVGCATKMTQNKGKQSSNSEQHKQNLLAVCLVSLGSTAAFSNQNM